MVLGCWATLGITTLQVLLVSDRRTCFSFSPVLLSCYAGLRGIVMTLWSKAFITLVSETN
jgi:hypothetical protein